MAGMMLTHREGNRHKGAGYGPGGPRCACCADTDRKTTRRRVRRAEKRAWKGEIRRGDA